MRQRYIPYDIREDVKIAKIIPVNIMLTSVAIITGVFLIQMFAAAIGLKIKFLTIIALYSASFIYLIIGTLDIPGLIKKRADYNAKSRKAKYLEDIIASNKKPKAYYAVTVPPWESAPDGDKETRANGFARECMSMLADGASIAIYGVCKAESTAILETRAQKAALLPPGLKQIEQERINYHYAISKNATITEYYSVVSVPPDKQSEGVEPPDKFISAYQMGDEMIDELRNHLTPGVKMKRGEQ